MAKRPPAAYATFLVADVFATARGIVEAGSESGVPGVLDTVERTRPFLEKTLNKACFSLCWRQHVETLHPSSRVSAVSVATSLRLSPSSLGAHYLSPIHRKLQLRSGVEWVCADPITSSGRKSVAARTQNTLMLF